MNCPDCGAALAGIDDPTQRFAVCESCGKKVDLAAAGDDLAGATIVTPPPPSDPNLGRTLASGRYRIDSVLGRGGMGTVYLGTQLALDRRVAIKVLSPEFSADEEFRKRFAREAGALAALDHPNIVAIHDLGVEEGTHYIVMSYVAGPDGAPMSLKDLVRAGPVEEELALRILAQVSAALHFAHGRGIVHRDIKPGNILLDADGNAKLADFGIARVSVKGESELTLTQPGMTMGTLKYMAPEQKEDAKHADARSDIYSLGVVFYEMLTGTTPEGRFELPSEMRKNLDPRIDRIVERALQRAVDNRYQSAEDIERDISKITTEREYGKIRAESGAPAAAGSRAAAPAGPVAHPPPPGHPAATAASGGNRGVVIALSIGVGVIVIVLIAALSMMSDSGADNNGAAASHHSADAGPSAARKRIMEVIAGGGSPNPSNFQQYAAHVERPPSADDVAAARTAVGQCIGLVQSRQYGAAAAHVPDCLVPVLAKRINQPAGQVRPWLASMYAQQPAIAAYQVGQAMSVDTTCLLVAYVVRYYAYGAVNRGVATAIRENGEWKVLL